VAIKAGVKVEIVDLLGLIGQANLNLSYEFTVSAVFLFSLSICP
jgi:hypothetical protein